MTREEAIKDARDNLLKDADPTDLFSHPTDYTDTPCKNGHTVVEIIRDINGDIFVCSEHCFECNDDLKKATMATNKSDMALKSC